MSFSQFLIRGALSLSLFAGLASAQSIAVLTGSQGTSTTIPVISVSPYGPLTTADPVPPGAFQILFKPDGFKYYVISNASLGITVLNQNFGSPRQIATAIQTPPTKAAISPDGRYLVVLTGSSAYVIDTQTDTLRNPNGISITGTPTDIAFSVDGLTAYILSNASFAATITPISLGTLTIGTPLTRSVFSAATSLTTGPTGLLYLTEPNALVEINPRTLQVTANGVLAVNGTPGQPAFSADGRYAYTINRTPTTGAAMIFDLASRTSQLVTNSNLGGASLDRIIPLNANRVLAFSSQNHTIYELSLGGGLSTSSLNNIFAANSINDVLPSAQSPIPTLYVSTTSGNARTLNQVQLGTNSILGQQSIPNQNGQLLVWAAANPTSGAAAMQIFNASQTVAAGDVSRPLGVRILDANGRPVFGAKVDFTAPTGITLSSASAFTNSEGYAAVNATAGTTAGVFIVQATSQGVPSASSFTINIPVSGGGGGGGCTQNCTAAKLQTLTGNGQIISEQATASQLLMVGVLDASSIPVVGTTVSFAVTQGLGTISCTTVGDSFPIMPTGTCTRSDTDSNLVTVVTDDAGRAAVKFLSTSTFSQSFKQTVVTATSGNAAAAFTITTVLVQRPNNGGQASLPVAYVIEPQPETSGYRVIRGTAGQTIAGAIQVQVVAADGPQAGQAIPGVALNVSGYGSPTSSPSASCAGGTPFTDEQGIATCNVVLGPVVSPYPAAIDVNVGGAIQTSQITVIVAQGQAAKVNVVSGNQQTGKSGQQLTLKGQVVDAAGNPVPNTAVSWTVPQGSATLSSSSTQTDAQGFASTAVTLGANPGTVLVKLSAGSGASAPSATFTLTVLASASGISAVSGGGQSGIVGQQYAQPIVVKVVDTAQNPVQGVTVNFTVLGGTANPASPTTDASGLASTTITAGQTAGTIAVTASIGSASTQFSLTSRVAGPAITPSSFRNGASGATGLTPCGIAIVSGTGLGAGIQGVRTVQPNQFVGPLPYTLAGVSLEVNGLPAPIFWVSNEGGQEAVAFQTPCETNPGSANVAIHVNGGTTTVTGVPVYKFQPGIFETVYNGKKYAVLLHAADGSYVTPSNPVHAGEQVVMFLTGLGPVTPATGTNRGGIGGQTPIANIITGVNNSGVRVVKSEYMPGAIGIYTVTFEVPANTQTGSYQNLGFIVHDPADPAASIYAPGSFLQILP